jgi:hypothetical protein
LLSASIWRLLCKLLCLPCICTSPNCPRDYPKGYLRWQRGKLRMSNGAGHLDTGDSVAGASGRTQLKQIIIGHQSRASMHRVTPTIGVSCTIHNCCLEKSRKFRAESAPSAHVLEIPRHDDAWTSQLAGRPMFTFQGHQINRDRPSLALEHHINNRFTFNTPYKTLFWWLPWS